MLMGLYGTRGERGAEMGKAKDMTDKKMGRLKVLTRVEKERFKSCKRKVYLDGYLLDMDTKTLSKKRL